MCNKNVVISVLLLLIISIPGFSTITEARNSYKSGNYDDALTFYNSWLEENTESGELFKILIEISNSKGSIERISLILTMYTDYLNDRDEKKILYKKIADLLSLTGDFTEAQKYYIKASMINLEEIDYPILLESAKLLIFQGEFLSAESQLEEIIINSDDQFLQTNARLYYSVLRIIKFSEYTDISELNVNAITPENSYLLYLLSKITSDNLSVDKLKTYIQENYTLSPEYALLNDGRIEYPNIISSFGFLNRNNDRNSASTLQLPEVKTESLDYMVQAGSFRDSENARYLSSDLKEIGFFPVVEEQEINEIKYYKVLLYFATQSESKKALLRLKSEGFDGFPIY